MWAESRQRKAEEYPCKVETERCSNGQILALAHNELFQRRVILQREFLHLKMHDSADGFAAGVPRQGDQYLITHLSGVASSEA